MTKIVTLIEDRMVRLHTHHHVIPKGSNDISVITASPSSSSLEFTGAWEWTLRLRLAPKREKIGCLFSCEEFRTREYTLTAVISSCNH